MLVVLVLLGRTAAADTLLVLGDSLSAGYGLPRDKSWVNLMAQRLAEDGSGFGVVNASISGETTAGGKRRIGDLLSRHKPVVAIIELGANDGLRGTPVTLIDSNLAAIVETCRKSGVKVLVVGMRIPPNYGRAYAEKFHAVFHDVANRYGAALVPFMFDGFADDRALFQDDGIHPNAKAQPLIMDIIYGQLRSLL